MPRQRREFRPGPASELSYPLGTSPVNNKVNTIQRVRTENGWLREEIEMLRMQLAAEAQLNQYRIYSFNQEKQALENRIAEFDSAAVQAQKHSADARAIAKRREGLVHQVKYEEQRRKQVLRSSMLHTRHNVSSSTKCFATDRSPLVCLELFFAHLVVILQIRERVVRRILSHELQGAKGVIADWTLSNGGDC